MIDCPLKNAKHVAGLAHCTNVLYTLQWFMYIDSHCSVTEQELSPLKAQLEDLESKVKEQVNLLSQFY